jgi:hypothetical protein
LDLFTLVDALDDGVALVGEIARQASASFESIHRTRLSPLAGAEGLGSADS